MPFRGAKKMKIEPLGGVSIIGVPKYQAAGLACGLQFLLGHPRACRLLHLFWLFVSLCRRNRSPPLPPEPGHAGEVLAEVFGSRETEAAAAAHLRRESALVCDLTVLLVAFFCVSICLCRPRDGLCRVGGMCTANTSRVFSWRVESFVPILVAGSRQVVSVT